MRVEGLAVAGREGRHPVRLGLTLVLEERVAVAVDDFPQNTVHPEDIIGVEGRPGCVAAPWRSARHPALSSVGVS